MNFIAHRELVDIDPCVNVGLISRDDDLSSKLNRAIDALEKFDWRNLQTACVNGGFGSLEGIELQIKELSRFLVLKAITDEEVTPILAPSKMIERIWRLLILFSKDYRYLCDNILSEEVECRFIDHDPLDNAKESKHLRYYNTISLYCKIFKEMPPLAVWPHPEPVRRRKLEHLSYLNSTLHLATSPHTPPSASSKKRLRFNSEIEVKVYTRDSEATSPPVAVHCVKPLALQVTPTKSTSGNFAFDSPIPPSTPSPSAFLMACQRVIKSAKQDAHGSPSRRSSTESPPTLPVSVFSHMEITPERGSPPRQQITLRFIDMDKEGDKFDLNTKFGTSFKIILANYKKKRNIFTYRSVKFNGVEVDEDKCPNDLGMSSHDRLEVYGSIAIVSSGNYSSNNINVNNITNSCVISE